MENQQTSPEEHLNRVSEGLFPPDTRDFLTSLVNRGLKDPRHVKAYSQISARLKKYQRDRILQELWQIAPGDSDQARAKALISGFSRFSGRVVAGRPVTALYARLRALESAGIKMPGLRQLLRICTG